VAARPSGGSLGDLIAHFRQHSIETVDELALLLGDGTLLGEKGFDRFHERIGSRIWHRGSFRA
jgi:hypothetical protein